MDVQPDQGGGALREALLDSAESHQSLCHAAGFDSAVAAVQAYLERNGGSALPWQEMQRWLSTRAQQRLFLATFFLEYLESGGYWKRLFSEGGKIKDSRARSRQAALQFAARHEDELETWQSCPAHLGVQAHKWLVRVYLEYALGQTRLWTLATNMAAGTGETAADIIQDAVLNLLKSRCNGEPKPVSVSQHVKWAACGAYRDEERDRKLRRQLVARLAGRPEQCVDNAVDCHNAFSRLSQRDQVLLTLRAAGFAYQETASILQLPTEQAARQAVKRARDRLRRKLGPA